MDDPIDPDSLTDPCAAAAGWFARVRSGRMDDAERQRLAAWLQADPRNALEYRRAQGIWNAMTMVPEDRLRALARPPAADAAPRSMRRRLTLGLGLACSAGAVGVGWPLLLSGSPVYSARFSTDLGQRRTETLPDGSVLDMNTASRLSVRFYPGRRVVELEAGEVAFEVAPDMSSPFRVQAGDTQVRVTGTLFNVRRDDSAVRVTVASGAVDVRHGAWWERSAVRLAEGQGTCANAASGLAPAAAVDTETVLAWRHGRLVFRDTPLADAVAELNRYTHRTIRLGEPALAPLRVAGVFSTDKPQSFLDLLPDILSVRVIYRTDGSAIILRRHG